MKIKRRRKKKSESLTVAVNAFNFGKDKTEKVGDIIFDGKKITATSDHSVMRYVLRKFSEGTRLVAAAAAALAWMTIAPLPAEPKVDWQSSTAERVKLGIRDKYGVLGSFQATFHVIAPDKGEYTKTITVPNNDGQFGYVLFPDDFGSQAGAKPGVYKWFTVVNGKQVMSGQFEVISNLNYSGVHIPNTAH
jgi:hypothetical protein